MCVMLTEKRLGLPAVLGHCRLTYLLQTGERVYSQSVTGLDMSESDL